MIVGLMMVESLDDWKKEMKMGKTISNSEKLGVAIRLFVALGALLVGKWYGVF